MGEVGYPCVLSDNSTRSLALFNPPGNTHTYKFDLLKQPESYGPYKTNGSRYFYYGIYLYANEYDYDFIKPNYWALVVNYDINDHVPDTCGNGWVEMREQCDDGNLKSLDGCD